MRWSARLLVAALSAGAALAGVPLAAATPFPGAALAASASPAATVAGPSGRSAPSPGTIPPAPPASAPVVDQARILDPQTLAQLEARLGNDNRNSADQIAVATVDGTGGITLAGYTAMLLDTWGRVDWPSGGGVVIVLDAAAGDAAIAANAVLAPRLSAGQAGSIVRSDMIPSIRAGHPGTALLLGSDAVVRVAGIAGSGRTSGTPSWTSELGWVVAAAAIVALVAGRSGQGRGWLTGGGRPSASDPADSGRRPR